MEGAAFHFLNNHDTSCPCSGWQCQDSSCSNGWKEHEESFSHMNWHPWVQTLKLLKVVGIVLEETLQSAGLFHCQ